MAGSMVRFNSRGRLPAPLVRAAVLWVRDVAGVGEGAGMAPPLEADLTAVSEDGGRSRGRRGGCQASGGPRRSTGDEGRRRPRAFAASAPLRPPPRRGRAGLSRGLEEPRREALEAGGPPRRTSWRRSMAQGHGRESFESRPLLATRAAQLGGLPPGRGPAEAAHADPSAADFRRLLGGPPGLEVRASWGTAPSAPPPLPEEGRSARSARLPRTARVRTSRVAARWQLSLGRSHSADSLVEPVGGASRRWRRGRHPWAAVLDALERRKRERRRAGRAATRKDVQRPGGMSQAVLEKMRRRMGLEVHRGMPLPDPRLYLERFGGYHRHKHFGLLAWLAAGVARYGPGMPKLPPTRLASGRDRPSEHGRREFRLCRATSVVYNDSSRVCTYVI